MKKLTILVLITILFVTILQANDKLLNDLRAKYDGIKTFEADITQSAFIVAWDMTTEAKGVFLIDNDIIVIEFTEPMRQYLKIEKNVMTLYMAEENTAYVDNNFDEKFGIFNLSEFLTTHNRFELLRRENGLVVYNVINLKEPELKITMYLNPNTILISKVIMEQRTGDITTIELKNQKFNQRLSKRISDFVIPQGTEIIRN